MYVTIGYVSAKPSLTYNCFSTKIASTYLHGPSNAIQKCFQGQSGGQSGNFVFIS